MRISFMTKKITRTFPEFFDHLKRSRFRPTVCIDIGAAAGTPSIYQAFPDSLHVAFEPLVEFQPQLKEALKTYKHEIHQCALMDKPEQRSILRQPNNLFTSSLMHTHQDDHKNVVTIPISTLDEKMSLHELSGRLLIKTDCQGADLFALKGGLETLKKADIVIVETSLFRFWGPHQPDFAEIVLFMRQQKFVVYDILDGLLRPFDNALGQVDLVFAKRNGKLRRTNQW
jgi:FkbM family methyltransferase